MAKTKKDRFGKIGRFPRKREKDTTTNNKTSRVRLLLEGIGAPEPTPFKPDEFQLEALKAIENFDVLVTAPTGAGKTWIAREEIRRLLNQGKRAWYTTPLKALTNSKYIEFCEEFGSEQVGILTGDRRENPKAPIIVGTTEIYRNQLFDALRKGENVNTDFVILDEAHYLSDDERGHVWEEAIILTPSRIRLLLLSATIGNPVELANWIEEVRGTKVKIVKATKRPVELRAACLLPNLELVPLFSEKTKNNLENADLNYYQNLLRSPEIPPPRLIDALREFNLLPAIVFMPTRRRCDEAAVEVLHGRSASNKEKKQRRKDFIRDFEKTYPEIQEHRHKSLIIQAGVASHHAGHLPAWKLLVEKMMSAGLLDAIFATSTVAAGVDFPARTVVIVNADARGNEGWRPLQVNELQQMTGRAGRRGKDKVGFIVLAPSFFQNPMRIAGLLKSAPEPLVSKFRPTYTSLLNLLDAYGSFAQIRQIAEKSFAFREISSEILQLEEQKNKRLKMLEKDCIKSGFLDSTKGHETFSWILGKILGYERLISARQMLFEKNQSSYQENSITWLKENVRPGRIISKKAQGNKFLMVLKLVGEKVIAIKEDGRGASLNLRRIKRVFANQYNLDKMLSIKSDEFSKAFNETSQGQNPLLEKPDFRENETIDEAIEIIDDLLEEIKTEILKREIRSEEEVEQFLWAHLRDAELIERNEKTINSLKEKIWAPFEKRARVLAQLGYLDLKNEKVTEIGSWLADLRVDRPLLIGEALRRISFKNSEPKHFAAFIGALAADKERSFGYIDLENETLYLLTSLEEIIFDVAKIEWKYGIQPETEMNFSAAAAVEKWAKGIEWKELVRKTKAEEGDLIRLLSRTGEVLLQIAHLKNLTSNFDDEHKLFSDEHTLETKNTQNVFKLSSMAAELILREPVR
jgi:superfamily II RNA helicase